MKFFKTHLSLILPLLFMMFAFEFILITNATLKHYEELVNKDYNIIVVSKTELDQNVVKTKVPSGVEKASINNLQFSVLKPTSFFALAKIFKNSP